MAADDLEGLSATMREAMAEYADRTRGLPGDAVAEAARRAFVRRWAYLAEQSGHSHWVLDVLVRAVDRLDARDAQVRRVHVLSVGETWRDVPLAVLREWFTDRVTLSSLRAVGQDCGVSHSTLGNFLNGADPQLRVRRSFAEFYLAETGEADADAPRAALAALTYSLGREDGRIVSGEILTLLDHAHAHAGRVAPPWIARLRALG